MCFIHVLLNALDLHGRGREGKIVIEGEAVTLITTMAKEGHILNPLYRQARERDLIAAVCLACASKLGAADTAKAEGLPLLGDMSNHPSMGHYLDQGYEVITF